MQEAHRRQDRIRKLRSQLRDLRAGLKSKPYQDGKPGRPYHAVMPTDPGRCGAVAAEIMLQQDQAARALEALGDDP